MDWFSWLSKTALDPPLIYEYGLVFSRNELQYEDIAYFNHEFLQSMGITVAKHRLEILKLAKKANGGNPKSLSRLFLAISRSKKSFGKYINKLVFQNDMSSCKDLPAGQKVGYQEHWKGALPTPRKQRSGDEIRDNIGPGMKNRALTLSGPLDSRVHERLMSDSNNNKSLKLSGPLDGRLHERLMSDTNSTKSLKLSGPLDGKLHERLMYPNRSPRLIGPGPLNGRTPVPERLIITTTRSPKLSGPLDGRVHDRIFVTPTKSPKLSGPLDGRVLSPKYYTPYEKEKVEVDEFDDPSLWTALFHDMKPT